MVHIYTMEYDGIEGKNKRITEHELGLALLERGLKENFSLSLSDMEIGRGSHGKPYFPELPEVQFNISHCSGLVVCAVGDSPVGIDAEQVRPVRDAVIRKVLSEKERFFLNSLAEDKRERAFFRYWTLKESCVKAEGCGISLPLSEVEFDLSASCRPDGRITSLSYDGYEFVQRCRGPYILSVCMKTDSGCLFMDEEETIWQGMAPA